MDSSTVENYTPTFLDQVAWQFHDLPAAWIAILTIALTYAALWLTRKALPRYRIIQALKTAPAVTLGSGGEGLVKVSGHADAGSEVPEGFSKPKHVWRENSKTDSGSIRSLQTSRTYSVAPIMIQDGSGACIVDPQQAVVVHRRVNASANSRFGGRTVTRIERIILVGDPVFGIGVLRRSAKDRGGKTPVSLRRSADGVLLLSARTEPETLRRFQLGFGFLAAAITVCTALATWMFIEHVSSYPNQSIPEYVDALMTRPWVLGPGQNPGN